MAFTDPLSITTAPDAAVSLPRTGTGDGKSTYSSSDGFKVFKASTESNGRRTRHLLRFDHSKIAVDPLAPSLNAKASASVYLVIDEPSNEAYTNDQLLALYVGFITLVRASSDALVTKVLGGES